MESISIEKFKTGRNEKKSKVREAIKFLEDNKNNAYLIDDVSNRFGIAMNTTKGGISVMANKLGITVKTKTINGKKYIGIVE